MVHIGQIYLYFLALTVSVSGLAQVILQKATPSDGSQLGFLVVGTIAQKTPDNNVALVKIKSSGSVTPVKISHVIDKTYKVTDITEKFIRVMTRDSKHYLVYLDRFAGEFRNVHTPTSVINPEGKYKEDGFERDAGKVVMTSAYRDRIVNQDLSTILMQATAEPYLQNGQIVGFKMSQIDTDSIFAKGGLRDEDVITSLNGQKLNNVAGAITLLKSLKGAASIDVELMRGGKNTAISINVN